MKKTAFEVPGGTKNSHANKGDFVYDNFNSPLFKIVYGREAAAVRILPQNLLLTFFILSPAL